MPITSWVGGFLGGAATSAGMELLGGYQRAISYQANKNLPNSSWGIEAYARAFQLGFINSETMVRHAKELGYLMDDVSREGHNLLRDVQDGTLELNKGLWQTAIYTSNRMVAMMKNMPSPDEILLLLNRKIIDRNTAHKLLMMQFGGESALAVSWLSLADQIPGPSDLISFAVRDVWSPDIVETFEYNKELPVDILPWMEKQGLGGKIGLSLPPGSTTTKGNDTRSDAQWFDAYWWAHWQLPSVGQGYEMLQRLYKTSKFGPSPYANDSTFFTDKNLELLQKANDFPPFWRARLQAIAFKPLGRIDIKRMYGIGVLEETDQKHEVFHAFRQQGYDDTNAERLTKFVVLTARKDIVRPAVAQVDKLYKLGTIDETKATKYLEDLHYPSEEVKTHLMNVELERYTEDTAKRLKFVKVSYMQGDVSDDQLKNLLINIGIVNTQLARYVSLWGLEKDTIRKHVSVAKAIELFTKGLINQQMLRTRLTNLHYIGADQDLLVQEAINDVLFKVNTQIAKNIEKATKAQTAAVEKLSKAQIAAAKELVANRAKIAKSQQAILKLDQAAYTEKNIIAFVKAGYLDLGGVRKALTDKGWTVVTQDRWIETNLPDLMKGKTNGTAPQTFTANHPNA